MLSDILWVLIILLFALPGLKYPYIALCGVIFVDIVKPQTLSYSFLAGKPIALIIALIFFFSLVVNRKQLSIPRKKLSTGLLIFFMAWITLATYNAEFQTAAWMKYDYVIKYLFFPLFIPFVLNNRIRIDTFIAVMVCSIGFFTIVLGVKSIVGGSGYGEQFIFSTQSNTGMTESSTMSMLAVFNLPFIIYIARYSIFKDKIPFLKPTSYFLGLTSLLSVVGSYARTGLVGLFVWVLLLLKETKKKFKYILIIIACIAVSLPFVPDEWVDRMNTITTASSESSAYGRIVVWKWTIDYVKERPIMGGGFYSYLANAGQLDAYIDDEEMVISRASTGKAFHSIYFEVLGELGYVGLFIYLWIIYLAFNLNHVLIKNAKPKDWVKAQENARKQALLIYCACGLFIGVAYYPWIFYLLGLAVSLDNVCQEESGNALESETSEKITAVGT